ncbi:MAG: type II CRISPR-associated endonuclease Cas1 [Lentisphaerae bacterium]|nr:type II CRISPR-associated endonuclease Cas1 [Lentisphaerota bacterium]
MIERIIEIAEQSAFLNLSNNLLTIRLKDSQTVTIPVGEVQCLILANPAVTITGALLSTLAENGAVVVISGKDRLPIAMQLPIKGNYVQNERFRSQIAAKLPLQKRLWQAVIQEKIRRQGELLQKLHDEDYGLLNLAGKVRSGDPDNIESRAAVIYWKNFWMGSFQRDREADDSNILLNYGYAILRAITARACCAAGLHPTIGINHHNRYNAYCLADDLMEPFRTVVDEAVYNLNPENKYIEELTQDMRRNLISALQGKLDTANGMWKINDLIQRSAQQTADSFQSGEMLLHYN